MKFIFKKSINIIAIKSFFQCVKFDLVKDLKLKFTHVQKWRVINKLHTHVEMLELIKMSRSNSPRLF